MSSFDEQNPFQSPSMPQSVAPKLHEPIHFGGSMSEAEGEHLCGLLKGRKANQISLIQLVVIGSMSLLMIGYFAAESIILDEPDQLLNAGLGFMVVVAFLAAVAYQQKVDRGLMARLKQERKGVFTELAGRVTEQGVEYLIGGYPLRYRWNDIVGCRIGEDAVVLYIGCPREVNFLAASLFEGPDHWEAARAVVRANVPRLKRFPNLQDRKTKQRMKHLATGIKALNQCDYQRALTEFSSALELEPSDMQALHGRMVAAVGLRDFDLALRAVEEVVALGTVDPTTRRMRSIVMMNQDRFEEALDDLDWLLEQSAEDSDLLRDRGLTLFKLGRNEEALRDASTAIELNPQDFVAFNNRGALFLQLGRREEAIADLETAIGLEPSFERPRQLLNEATGQGVAMSS